MFKILDQILVCNTESGATVTLQFTRFSDPLPHLYLISRKVRGMVTRQSQISEMERFRINKFLQIFVFS